MGGTYNNAMIPAFYTIPDNACAPPVTSSTIYRPSAKMPSSRCESTLVTSSRPWTSWQLTQPSPVDAWT